MTSFPLAIALFLILTSFSGCTAQVFRAPSTLIDRNAALNLKPALGSTGLLPVVSNAKLSGLLERQAGLCKTGMSACEGNAGSCCPTGGSCCVDPATTRVNACCGAGLKCCVATGYPVGCCDLSDDCVYTQGQSACCPTGQTCIACSDPADVPCPNADFCCPAGSTCVVGANQSNVCVSGSTSSTLSSTITQSTFTNVPTSTTISSGSLTTASTPGAAAAAFVNETVTCNDPAIHYDSGDWKNTTTCASPAMKASAVGSTMTCQFLGTALYLTSVVGQDAGMFTISVDGVATIVDGFSPTDPQCGIRYSQTGLASAMHNVSLTFNGPSPSAPQAAVAAFEYTGLIYSEVEGDDGDDGDNGSSSSAANPTSTSTSAGGSAVFGRAGLSNVFKVMSASWACMCLFTLVL